MRGTIGQPVRRAEARDGFTRDALASRYQENGRHLTGPEVRAWLNVWGTDEEADAPACHD
jgi:predicted transcriptional regulator